MRVTDKNKSVKNANIFPIYWNKVKYVYWKKIQYLHWKIDLKNLKHYSIEFLQDLWQGLFVVFRYSMTTVCFHS